MAWRTQKQVARKYEGNLDYPKKKHLFRRFRFALTCLAFLGGIAMAAVYLSGHGSDPFYNPGPISQKHAEAHVRCDSCHQMRQPDFTRMISSAKVVSALSDTMRHGLSADAVNSFSDRVMRGVSYGEIDKACLACHIVHDIHQPDIQTVALLDFRKRIAVVHTGSCTSCHREHIGSAAMKLPDNTACATCHSDPMRMADSQKGRLPGKSASPIGIDRKLADNLIHFIPPQTFLARTTFFKEFANGHPAFEYEKAGLRDPDVLRFNHQLHLQGNKIPKINGKKLDCAFCHKPAANGIYYQRVVFEVSCQPCHSLQFDPKNRELEIPHGDTDKARAFLHSLPYQYANLAAKKGKIGIDAQTFVNQQLIGLRDRMRAGDDVEKVFFTTNPYRYETDHELFPGCAFCHEVKNGANGAPVITNPVQADRWLNHGAFTHATHTQIACDDCHHAAQSHDTADILMPAQKSCAECHRIAVGSKSETTAAAGESDQAAVERMRKHGGATSACIVCHTFHAPADASETIQATVKGLLLSGR